LERNVLKNRNSAQYCHDVEGAVLKVQGPNLNIEMIQKMMKNI
jgi:hypothetical protein